MNRLSIMALPLMTLIGVTALADGSLFPDGLYSKNQKIWVIESDLEDAEVVHSNTLQISATSQTTAEITVHLMTNNGGRCGLSGSAKIEGQDLVHRSLVPVVSQKGTVMAQCELHVSRVGNKMKLTDVGDVCRERSCGATIGFDGAEFDIPQK
jgi:hypothetical protein